MLPAPTGQGSVTSTCPNAPPVRTTKPEERYNYSQLPDEFILAMGADRLGALHIHDVSKTEDSHTIPYQGVIDWQKLMQALKTIGYKGDLTFEADGFINKVPPELCPEALCLLGRTGHVLMKKMQSK